MFTIQRGNKTVGLMHKNHHFVIGFKSVTHARQVQYHLHPDPTLTLVRGDEIDLRSHLEKKGIKQMSLIIDTKATLFLPKFKGTSTDPMNDGGYHLNNILYNDFVTYPVTKMVGIIMPYDLVEETAEEFMFRSHLIEPSFNSKLFG
jgi:hypothetical protein